MEWRLKFQPLWPWIEIKEKVMANDFPKPFDSTKNSEESKTLAEVLEENVSEEEVNMSDEKQKIVTLCEQNDKESSATIRKVNVEQKDRDEREVSIKPSQCETGKKVNVGSKMRGHSENQLREPTESGDVTFKIVNWQALNPSGCKALSSLISQEEAAASISCECGSQHVVRWTGLSNIRRSKNIDFDDEALSIKEGHFIGNVLEHIGLPHKGFHFQFPLINFPWSSGKANRGGELGGSQWAFAAVPTESSGKPLIPEKSPQRSLSHLPPTIGNMIGSEKRDDVKWIATAAVIGSVAGATAGTLALGALCVPAVITTVSLEVLSITSGAAAGAGLASSVTNFMKIGSKTSSSQDSDGTQDKSSADGTRSDSVVLNSEGTTSTQTNTGNVDTDSNDNQDPPVPISSFPEVHESWGS